MRTVYTTLNNNVAKNYYTTELKEQIQTIDSAIDYIIAVSGSYCAAIEFLKANKIETRLDDYNVQMVGMPLLAELREIKTRLEGELADEETQS